MSKQSSPFHDFRQSFKRFLDQQGKSDIVAGTGLSWKDARDLIVNQYKKRGEQLEQENATNSQLGQLMRARQAQGLDAREHEQAFAKQSAEKYLDMLPMGTINKVSKVGLPVAQEGLQALHRQLRNVDMPQPRLQFKNSAPSAVNAGLYDTKAKVYGLGDEPREGVYIRFGRPPKDGSSIGNTSRLEKGVSTYVAWQDPKTGKYIIGANPGGEADNATLDSFVGTNRKAYIISGKELADVGADGEHLLDPKTTRIVGEIPTSQITDANMEYTFDGNELAEEARPVIQEMLSIRKQSPEYLQARLKGMEHPEWGEGYYITKELERRGINPNVAQPSKADALEDQARKYFGITTIPKASLYIDSKGNYLDGSGFNQGSGVRNTRYTDHSEIKFINDDEPIGMYDYMNKTNNIRTGIMDNQANIDIVKMPNEKQLQALEKATQGKTIYADITDPKTEKVVADGEFSTFAEYRRFLEKHFREDTPSARFKSRREQLKKQR